MTYPGIRSLDPQSNFGQSIHTGDRYCCIRDIETTFKKCTVKHQLREKLKNPRRDTKLIQEILHKKARDIAFYHDIVIFPGGPKKKNPINLSACDEARSFGSTRHLIARCCVHLAVHQRKTFIVSASK